MEHTEVIKPKTLVDLINVLHQKFESDNFDINDAQNRKEVQNIMEAYDSNPQDWDKYFFKLKSRYTRNLVDEGKGKFVLMILCWDKKVISSIHDHTHSHCFMKILQGQLKETTFEWPDPKTDHIMVPKSQTILQENQVAYIDDSIGLHQVENDSDTVFAGSLHLYIAPFQNCQSFDQKTGHKEEVEMSYYSKFGKLCETQRMMSHWQ